MNATSPQRSERPRRLPLRAVALVTLVALLTALWGVPTGPAATDHPGTASLISAASGSASPPGEPWLPPGASAPPNLADPAVPLPADLSPDIPVRLVVDHPGATALRDLDPRLDVVVHHDDLAVVTAAPHILESAVDRLRQAGATRIELDGVARSHSVVIPTDPLWSLWWGGPQFHLPQAWGTTLGGASTVIAIIDSGVTEIPELQGRVLPGITYLGAGADPRDDLDGHGTNSAVTAAGGINNGIASVGACPQCLVLPVQVLDPVTKLAYLSDIAAGIRWATDNGADVISISLGGPATISALGSAVNYANSRGVIVIASAGNEGDEVVNYPAGLTNVVGVAALTQLGELYSWSTRGSWVTTAVAGCSISPRISDGAAMWYCGTSAAAPLLAGGVALLHHRFPNSTVAALTQRIADASTPGVATAFGSASAAALVTPEVPPGVTPPGAPSITSVTPGAAQLTLAVAAPTSNGGSAVTAYEASVDDGPFATVEVPDPAAASVSITIGNLTNGTSHRVRVRAVNVAGAGSASSEVAGTPRTTPGAMATPELQAAGSTALRVDWTLPDTGGSPLTSIDLQWELGESVGASPTLVELPPTATSWIVDDLLPASTVAVRLRAHNEVGPGPWSEVATGSTDADGNASIVTPPIPEPLPEPEPEPELQPLPPAPFVDVPTGSWFNTSTRWAFAVGVTTGVSDTSFGPARVLTRAEWLTMLWRLAGRPEPTGPNPFTDVPSGTFYTKAAMWAFETEVTTGTGDGSTFAPGRTITRAEVVTMLWRYAGEPTPESLVAFSDVGTNRFFAAAVAWAKEVGVSNGMGDTGRFVPGGQSTRAEAVTLLWRFVGEPVMLAPPGA